MPALPQDGADRTRLAVHRAQTVAAGQQINLHERCDEIESCRKQGRQRHIRIRHFQKGRHQECRCTHDRRHQLTTCGSHGFDSTRILRAVAGTTHQGNGDNPGRHHVGDSTAGNRPEQGRGDHRNLRRSADLTAQAGAGKFNEELTTAAGDQHAAKKDKQNDDLCHNRQRCPQHRIRIKGEIEQQVLQADFNPGQGRRRQMSDQRVKHEGRDNDEHHHPGQPPEGNHDHRGHHDTDGLHLDGAEGEAHLVFRVAKADQKQQHHGSKANDRQQRHPEPAVILCRRLKKGSRQRTAKHRRQKLFAGYLKPHFRRDLQGPEQTEQLHRPGQNLCHCRQNGPSDGRQCLRFTIGNSSARVVIRSHLFPGPTIFYRLLLHNPIISILSGPMFYSSIYNRWADQGTTGRLLPRSQPNHMPNDRSL